MHPLRSANAAGHRDALGRHRLDDAVWTVPEAFEKSGETLRVPLSPRLLEIIRNQLPADRPTGAGRLRVPWYAGWPGRREGQQFCGKPIARLARCSAFLRKLGWSAEEATIHGFRSTVRDWAGQATDHQPQPCEAMLSHVFAKGDVGATTSGESLFDKRRALMNDWSDVCMGVRPATRTIEQRAA